MVAQSVRDLAERCRVLVQTPVHKIYGSCSDNRETGDTFCKNSQCCCAPSNYLVETNCSINCIIKQKGDCTQLEVCCHSDVE